MITLDMKLAIRCGQIMYNVQDYKERMQYNTKYIDRFLYYERLYYTIKGRITDKDIIKHLNNLEGKLL